LISRARRRFARETRIPRALTLAALLLPLAAPPGRADPPADSGSAAATPGAEPGFFDDWMARVSRTQAEQPHWITPLVTVTPRLEQELRYDQFWQVEPGGATLTSYGGGKGLELIPSERVELILGVPAWQAHGHPGGDDGWSDESFLVKYRLLAANEANGNYILSLFLGFTAPTGSAHNSADHVLFTPSLAFGKGWGDFDLQSTIGIAIPDDGAASLGTPLLVNTAFQYHVLRLLWPQLELNYTAWPNGEHGGRSQLFLTPGIVLGRLPIHERLGLTLGVGYQSALTHYSLYRRRILLSVRLPF
jgi:hypothetical protein